MTLPAIPDWLRTGISHTGSQVMVAAQQAYRLSAVHVDLPLLILPMAGIKRMELSGVQGSACPGQFMMVHQVACPQVENVPPSLGESYRAWLVTLPWRVVEMARTLLQTEIPPNVQEASAPFTIDLITPLLSGLKRLLEVLTMPNAPPQVSLDYALLGVAIALAHSGHGQFLYARDPSISSRIRQLVSTAPEHEWSSSDFEDRLHVSGATLRRRLADEGTSLRELLREARLHHGLALLQTTRKPVKSVAQACGYRSAPCFTRNFIARFGINPSTVANS